MNKVRESKVRERKKLLRNDSTMREFSEMKKWLNYEGTEGVLVL